MSKIKQLEEEYKNALGKAASIEFALHCQNGLKQEEKEELERQKKEALEGLREASTKYFDAMPGFREFEKSQSRFKPLALAIDAFMKIPKKYRRAALKRSTYRVYEELKKANALEIKDEMDQKMADYYLNVGRVLKRLVNADSVDDLNIPLHTEAIRMLERIRWEQGLSWRELRTKYGVVRHGFRSG